MYTHRHTHKEEHILIRRRRWRVVEALVLWSGGRRFKCSTDHLVRLFPGSPKFRLFASLPPWYHQLGCLQPGLMIVCLFAPTIQLEYLQTSWSRLDYCHSLYSQVREESVLGRLAAGFSSFTSLKESLIKSSKLASLSVKNSSYIAISRQSHKTIPVFWQVMEKFAYNKRHQNNSLWINM